ncbi:MAG TPA: FAD-binding oxidoreductase, partial [Thermomicrobiales bacterium]|nr:FAD-binding oxidoreductase [Thermomicrobiales bacterium]
MNTTTVTKTSQAQSIARILGDAFAGAFYLPGDAGYDPARLPWQRAIDPHPAIVAEAHDAADVRAAVIAAREHQLPLAVQSTGHGAIRPADGGLLLKTSRMNGVRVDPEWRVARIGPGALWSDVIAAAAPYGLAPLSGTSVIGVTGYTLGGGAGWLSRKYGFAADSLLRAEVVNADGRVLVASAGEHPDLFWALRGGSGNFGIVTDLAVRLYPVGPVYAGTAFFEPRHAVETFACYRDWAMEEPDELNTAVTLLTLPPVPPIPEPLRGKQVLAIRAFSLSSAEKTERLLEPLFAAAGAPLMNGFGEKDFAGASLALGGAASPPMAVRQHIDLFDQLPDTLIDLLIEASDPVSGSPVTAIEVRHWGGAMSRPAPDAGPVGHRHVPFSVIASAILAAPDTRDRTNAYVDTFAANLQPYA